MAGIKSGEVISVDDFPQIPNGLEHYGVRTDADGQLHQEFSKGSAITQIAGEDLSPGDIVGVSSVFGEIIKPVTSRTFTIPGDWITNLDGQTIFIAENKFVHATATTTQIQFAIGSFINHVVTVENVYTMAFNDSGTIGYNFAIVKVRDNVFALLGEATGICYTFSVSGYTPTLENTTALALTAAYGISAIYMQDDRVVANVKPGSTTASITNRLIKWVGYVPAIISTNTTDIYETVMVRHSDTEYLTFCSLFVRLNSIAGDVITLGTQATVIGSASYSYQNTLEYLGDNIYIVKPTSGNSTLVDVSSGNAVAGDNFPFSSFPYQYFFFGAESPTKKWFSDGVLLQHTGSTFISFTNYNTSFGIGLTSTIPRQGDDFLSITGINTSTDIGTYYTNNYCPYHVGIVQNTALKGGKVRVLLTGIDENQSGLLAGLKYTVSNGSLIASSSGEYRALSDTKIIII